MFELRLKLHFPQHVNSCEDTRVVGKACLLGWLFFVLFVSLFEEKIIAEMLNTLKYSLKFIVDGINDPSLRRSSYLCFYHHNFIMFSSQV